MASIEVNINKKSIFNELFSKDNRLILHKQILNKLNLNEISKEGKKQILEILQKNMKSIYDKLKLDKINNSNFKSIKVQFNNASLEQTIGEISSQKKSSKPQNETPQKDASILKFERDFNSNPNSGNKIMDRPQAITNKKNQEQFLYPPGFEKSNPNNLDPRFDKLFKPIVENLDDNYKFNQYQSGKGGAEFSNKYDQLMSEREIETSIPKRPSTPDFLKPINTSTKGPPEREFKSNNDFSNTSNKKGDRSLPQIKKRNGRPNFSDKIPEEELDTGFLSSNDNNDFYDINNIDKPIEPMEIEEDNRPFAQRLQSLERDRGAVSIQKPNRKINFQEETIHDDNMDTIPNLEPKSIEDIRKEKELHEISKMREERRDSRQDPRYSERQDPRYNEREDPRYNERQDPRYNERQDPKYNERQDPRYNEREDPRYNERQDSRNNERQDPRNNERQDSRNNEREDFRNNEREDRIVLINEKRELREEDIDLKKDYQKEYMEKQNKTLQHLQYLKDDDENELESTKKTKPNKNINMNKVQDALKKLGINNDNSELIELKKELKILRKKVNENNSVDDRSKFEFVKKEIGSEFTKLHEKENEIKKKEDEMKGLLKKYNYLYGLRHIQMDISPQNPSSKYVFEFKEVKHINAIKLMSYSIPIPRFNIEENKNNIFKIKYGDEIKEIKLNSGKYKIDHLLKLLTEKSNFNFELNYEEKVEIKLKKDSNDDENNIKTDEENNIKPDDGKKFDIIPTPLSVEVLGFTKEYTNENNYTAEKTWDLRIEDKVYLFINNLDENIPFAVLYLGNQAVQQFKFDESIDLDRLELEFKDSKARPYNFYGLTYSVNVQLEINDPNENELV